MPIVMGMASPRLTSTPVACAGCYGQYPDRAHVDYRAALEGRLVDPSNPRGRHVDWVIMCEKCLRDGVALLPEEADRRERDQLEIAELKRQLAEQREYTERLEATIAVRPTQPLAAVVKDALTERDEDIKAAQPRRRPRYAPKDES